MSLTLPRYVIAKPLKRGGAGYYFNVPKYFLNLGCPKLNQPLGTDYAEACGADGKGGMAETLNLRFDEWDQARKGEPLETPIRIGTIDWLFRTYKSSKAYLNKVAPRSRKDYERSMRIVTDIVTKKGDTIGQRSIRAITPVSADMIYDITCHWPVFWITHPKAIYAAVIALNGIVAVKTNTAPHSAFITKPKRLRQGEKVAKLCSKAWRVVRRLHPDEFDPKLPDPWKGVALARRVKKPKAAATREEVYAFAWGCIARGRPEPAAAAVICFEWLQRPENVLAGEIRWTDYRGREHPTQIRIAHHKTGAMVLHPLQEQTSDGVVRFYEEAEAVLANLPRRGVPMILRDVIPPKSRPRDRAFSKPFSFSGFEKIVQRMRAEIGLPKTFTLDACRHGGMTELEEAELTDGQGRALSAHSSKAYDGYAKRTEKRALAATRKRHAHVLANAAGTEFQNGQRNPFQNDENAAPEHLRKSLK